MNRTGCLLALGLALAVPAASPALADSFLVYTDGGIPAGSDIWTWCDAGQPCDMRELQECGTPEGMGNLRTNTNIWAGWGVFLHIDQFNQPQPENLSAYANGSMRFWVRTAYDMKVEFQCKVNGATQTKTRRLTQHGWNGTNTWQEITIPISSFFSPQPVDTNCLGAVVSPFMSTIENLPFFNTFRIDNVRWHKPNAHAGATSVQVQGRELLVNGKPFVLNGMAYAPISIGEDYHGAYRDRPDRYLVDFPLIAASGANAVRIYSSFMTTAMLDAAWAQGLYVIPTFPVNTAQLACTAGKDAMRERMREAVLEWKNHPAILFWLIGNEVNRNLTNADLCTNWYPQLDSMALAAHQAEGASFHPVATGNADTVGLADICQAGCSNDTSLPNLDLWGVQVYRSCSFGTLFNEYAQKSDCSKPLILTEFGADAWDSRLAGGSGAESQTMQADCLETLLADADEALAVRNPGGVSAGQILFEWADEWWKAFPPDPPVAGYCTATDWFVHDSCKNWENFGYPDPAMNEEWWGITGLDAANPSARNPRAAHARLNDAWYLGAVRDLKVVSHNKSTGATVFSFVPGAGSTGHTLYYGPLSAVSTYGYSGALSGLGATGSGSATLPAGSQFFVMVGRNNGAEGCYGKNSACVERPPYAGAGIPQTANRTCSVPQCP
jgi:hypothetical protein